jgi:hypothetical protein
MNLFQCTPAEIDKAWRDGACKLAEATKWAAREITTDQLKMLLSRGERTLIGCRDDDGTILGWAAVQVQQLPNLRVLYVYALQGKFVCNKEASVLLKQYAEANGCSSVRGAVRPSMERLLRKVVGAVPIYTVVEWEIV